MASFARKLVLGSVFLAVASTAPSQLYFANLDGPSESPPNASPGTGFALININVSTVMMSINMSFSGLVGTTTASHIHAATATPGTGTAGVATQTPTFAGFPLGVTSGSYSNTFDMSLSTSWNPAYITAHGGTPLTAWTDFTAAISQGRAYFNVHTQTFPGGEIRGFLTPVPEPGTLAVLSGLLGTAIVRRRRS